MPVRVRKKGSKFCVVEPNGTVVKCHPTEEKAKKHMAAININTSKGGKYGGSTPPEKKKKKKRETAVNGEDLVMMPKVIIISDGTMSSTRLLINGEEISPDSFSMHYTKPRPDAEFDFEKEGELSFHMGLDLDNGDGMATHVTLRLKKEE
jgi:hypothetical protein